MPPIYPPIYIRSWKIGGKRYVTTTPRKLSPTVWAGIKRYQQGYRLETPSFDNFVVFYILAGRLKFETPDFNAELRPGWIAIQRLGSAFTVSAPEGECRVLYVALSGHGEVSEYHGRASCLVATGNVQTLATLMLQNLEGSKLLRPRYLAFLGQALVWEANYLDHQAGNNSAFLDYAGYWANCARHAIDATLYNSSGVRNVLANITLSYSQVARHFRKIFGVSLKRYQTQARLKLAQRLLLEEPNACITTIAYSLAFSSSQHFARQFKAHFGRTPSEYRCRNLKRRKIN